MTTPAEINRRNREYYGLEPEPPTPPPYERRFVAYIDILGWKEAVCDPKQYAAVFAVARRLSALPSHFSRDLKDRLKKQPKGAVSDPSHQKAEVVAFSDNLVVSTPIEVGYTLFFKFLAIVCREVLTKGFLTRGGVTVGKLYHKENMVFGHALNDAVYLERNRADFPRLICSQALVENIKQSPNCERNDPQVIVKDQLGRNVVNLLAFEKQSNPQAWHDLEKMIADKIDLGDLPEVHQEKWRYMRDVLQIMIQRADCR
jgi:hypothetical protein